MPVKSYKKSSLFIASLLCCLGNLAQQVTIPWGKGINVAFGRGSSNPGPPLSTGNTGFIYTTDACVAAGQYTIANKTECNFPVQLTMDAGTTFFGIVPASNDSGYLMIVNAAARNRPQTLYADTVRNLCSNQTFLFWAGFQNLGTSSCVYPNMTMSIETLAGQTLQSFQTGNVGGSPDNFVFYPGFWPFPPPGMVKFPHYYGFYITLPAGLNDIVARITINPSNANSSCTSTFAVDNIMLTPMGPDVSIGLPGGSAGWISGGCFQGNTPVIINGRISPQNFAFGNDTYTSPTFTSPVFQWQQSIDGGFIWADVPGTNSADLSHHFSIADTFFVRLSAYESGGGPACSVVSNVIKVQVDGIPSKFSFSSNSPVCQDGDLQFSLSGGASYTITGPNGYYDNTPFPHIFNPHLQDTGWYYANIISYGGCAVTDSVNVQITGPDVKITADQSACYGKPVQLSAEGGIKYAWSPATGLSDTHISNPIATPPTTTKYKVTVTDQAGCNAFDYVTVTLRNGFLKAMIEGPQFACPSDIVLLKDTSVGAIVSWYWDFDNGQISGIKEPAPRPFLTINNILKDYRVKLIVTDTSGCADTAVKVVTAVPNCYIDVPNAFTPNNDGLNDYLYPVNAYKATSLRFRVFNRGGQMIFETRERNRKWDGTFKGEPQSPGTYIWLLEYTDIKGKKISLKGTAVLIR
ncbi:MAG: gliding motility-associated C-terminal domain-containing protein [Chitinophagaceae bacterium]|nr:gliding motility-associated C-terminal domain-containing protein [Chitinophagaceae bacterium]